MHITHILAKNKKYTAMEQLSSLRANFKGDRWVVRPNGFTWWFTVTPTPLSDTYTLKFVYSQNFMPKVYVVSPRPLRLAKGAKRLPHTYDTNKQLLCLYRPNNREWTTSKLISQTIVHWAVEWLYYYEDWAFSGVWRGGGHGSWDVQPTTNNKNL